MAGTFPGIFSFIPKIFFEVYTTFIFASVVQFWGGRDFYLAAWSGLKNKTASMDTLVALGTTAAYGFSIVNLFFPKIFPGGNLYFDTSAVIITLILLGRYLEAKAKARTSDAIKKLGMLQPKSARVVRGKEEIDIPIEEVKVGDLLRIRPGEKIPIDGIIVQGEASIDEAMVTGESLPVDKQIGSNVIGATLNINGTLVVKGTSNSGDTVLAGIIKLVSEAQGSKAPRERLADSVSSFFFPVVLALAALTFLVWISFGTLDQAIVSMISVLIIACPCALGLATPTAIIVAIGTGASRGILIKDAASLEILNKTKTLIFDKTGTLTQGKPRVTRIIGAAEIIRVAASLEQGSEHSLAEAVLEYAKDKQTALSKVESFRSFSGMGVVGVVDGKKSVLGNRLLMEKENIDFGKFENRIRLLEETGKTVALLGVNGKAMGAIAISDTEKPEAKEVIGELDKRRIDVWMVTGDNPRTAKGIAGKIGIKNILAGVLPSQKAQKVREFTGGVAFVGDGINDAPALAAADVGISMGTGTDVAIETSGITLVNSNLGSVLSALDLSRATLAIIKQNLFWAFGYNVLLIPVAMGVLYPFFGLLLNPMFASAAMAASSVSVVGTSLGLKLKKI